MRRFLTRVALTGTVATAALTGLMTTTAHAAQPSPEQHIQFVCVTDISDLFLNTGHQANIATANGYSCIHLTHDGIRAWR